MPRIRTAALATAALAVLAGGCGPGAGNTGDADQPVILEPGEEQGETLLPETPGEVEGTEG